MRETDGELARAAQDGDMAAFALLAERHRTGLHATAIGLLGYTTDAEDAVQEALLSALRGLSSLREPEAAGPWLKSIVRRACHSQLRARRPLPVPEPEPLLPPDAGLQPEEIVDRAGTGDWVQHAIASLPAGIREVTVLRYFTGLSSYAKIAELCGITPETVGSRLRDGRRALVRRLRDTADEAHADHAASLADLRGHAEYFFTAATEGTVGDVVEDWYLPEAKVQVLGGLIGDRSLLPQMLDRTLAAGVGLRIRDVAASRDVLVWETEFLNPPSDPEHCPPGVAAIYRLRGGRVERMGIAYHE